MDINFSVGFYLVQVAQAALSPPTRMFCGGNWQMKHKPKPWQEGPMDHQLFQCPQRRWWHTGCLDVSDGDDNSCRESDPGNNSWKHVHAPASSSDFLYPREKKKKDRKIQLTESHLGGLGWHEAPGDHLGWIKRAAKVGLCVAHPGCGRCVPGPMGGVCQLWNVV